MSRRAVGGAARPLRAADEWCECVEFFVPTNRRDRRGAPRGMDGMNEIIGQSRESPYRANRRKHANEAHVARYARSAMRASGWRADDSRVTVELVFIEPDMRRDDDNVFAGAKYILDALCSPASGHPRGCGAVPDDDPAHVRLLCRRGPVDRSNPGVLVRLRRASDDSR